MSRPSIRDLRKRWYGLRLVLDDAAVAVRDYASSIPPFQNLGRDREDVLALAAMLEGDDPEGGAA